MPIEIFTKVEKVKITEKRKLLFDEYSRYSRQLILPEIGKNGQENIINSKVLIVGCGGLGKHQIIYENILKTSIFHQKILLQNSLSIYLKNLGLLLFINLIAD